MISRMILKSLPRTHIPTIHHPIHRNAITLCDINSSKLGYNIHEKR